MTTSGRTATDPCLVLAHQLLHAYCATQCKVAVTAILDQVDAHLTADPTQAETRVGRMVGALLDYAADLLRASVAQRGHHPVRWSVMAPAGTERRSQAAWAVAQRLLNATLNREDTTGVVRSWVVSQPPGAAVDLVAETAWLARVVAANTSSSR